MIWQPCCMQKNIILPLRRATTQNVNHYIFSFELQLSLRQRIVCLLMIVLKRTRQKFGESSLSCAQEKNLFSLEYYRIWPKKTLLQLYVANKLNLPIYTSACVRACVYVRARARVCIHIYTKLNFKGYFEKMNVYFKTKKKAVHVIQSIIHCLLQFYSIFLIKDGFLSGKMTRLLRLSKNRAIF